MQKNYPKIDIPVLPAAGHRAGVLLQRRTVALMVLGDSMLPEFAEGEIIVIEPEGSPTTAPTCMPSTTRNTSSANCSARRPTGCCIR